MAKTITIHGDNIDDIPSFYEEINRQFMGNEDWQLSQSPDALNDLFYGGFGAIEGKEEILLVWENFSEHPNIKLTVPHTPCGMATCDP